MIKKTLKKLERTFEKGVKKTDKRRVKDERDAYLVPDHLLDRRALTKSGRAKLVLAYGTKGDTWEQSLSQLSDLAHRIEARQSKFESGVKGVVVQDLVRISTPADKQRAKDVKAATLFKFAGNLLHFRVTASGETPKAPSHYLVRVRLEEYHDAIKSGTKGNNYLFAAQQASRGHVSIDCACGRQQYFYRYLATIGGFGLTPEEHVYPKIRNRYLKGCCCKHVLKTLMVLQGSVVHGRIAKEMEAEAKRKGFGSSKSKYLSSDEVRQMEVNGQDNFEKMRKAFLKVNNSEEAKQARENITPKGKNVDDSTKVKVLETEFKKAMAVNKEKDRDILIHKLDAHMMRSIHVDKKSAKDAVKSFAEAHKMSVGEVTKLGKDSNVLNGYEGI